MFENWNEFLNGSLCGHWTMRVDVAIALSSLLSTVQIMWLGLCLGHRLKFLLLQTY